jgi:hypothetical protein
MKSNIIRTNARSTMPILVSRNGKPEKVALVNAAASVYVTVNFKNEILVNSNVKKPCRTPFNLNFYGIGSHVFQSVALVRYCSTTPI